MKKLLTLLTAGLVGCSVFNKQLERPIAPNRFDIEYTEKVMMNFFVVYNNAAKLNQEVPMCMFGVKNSDIEYIIDEVEFPLIFYSDSVSSSFNHNNCLERPDYLGMVHNHLHADIDNCYPSDIDLNRFLNEPQATLEAVICYPEKGPYIKTLSKDMLPKDFTKEFNDYYQTNYQNEGER